MPNYKKVVTRFPELFTDAQFRRDAFGRVTNVSRAQAKNIKRLAKRTFSKADRYTYRVLDAADTLAVQHKYAEADSLLINAITHYSGLKKSLGQKTIYALLALSDKRAHLSIQARTYNHSKYSDAINKYHVARKKRKPKIAVVTAISGGYDTLKPPATPDARYDYYVFSDTPVHDCGIFTVRPLPYIDGDTTRGARFIKTNVHRLLPEYEYVVWIDANLMIIGDIFPFIEKVTASKSDLGAMLHPLRSSLYDEGKACIEHGRGDTVSIADQMKYYNSINYIPQELFETNVLVYNLKSDRTKKFLNMWWNEIDKRSERDQLSVNYCADQSKLRWTTIMDWPMTARNHPSLALTRHGKHGNDGPLLDNLYDKIDSQLVEPMVKDTYPTARVNSSQHSVDIIYCVHNALDDVKLCLQSVKKYRKSEQLIIIDDGSDMPTKKYLEKFQSANKRWVIIHRSETGSGYTKAANRGLKLSSADFCILLNSDTIVTKHWVDKLVDAAYTNNDIGIVGPLSSAASQQSIPNTKNQAGQTATNELPQGTTPDDINMLCESESRKELMPRVPLVHGFCFGIKRETIDTIGYFDERNFPRGYGEENDYCFRAADAGFGLMIATNTYIFHAKSKSYIGPERVELMNAGMRALIKKHSQHRITRSVKTMEQNPQLMRIRAAAKSYYDSRR